MRINGRIPYIDSNNPDAWGRCDLTGLPVMYSDLRPQMEYIGETLQWTGLMVNKKDLDEPNPQLIPPRLKPDPLPVRNPRYFPLPKQPGIPTGLTAGTITKNSISISWNPVIATPGSNIGSATNYAVYWTPLYGVEQSTLPLTNPTAMTEIIHTIPNLMPGTTYIIQVASINNVGYQQGIHGVDTVLTYNLSSPSYGPPNNVYSGRVVPNPYAFLSVTTLTS